MALAQSTAAAEDRSRTPIPLESRHPPLVLEASARACLEVASVGYLAWRASV